jgi:hypothetical protein
MMMMFEVGKTYHVKMWEPGANGGAFKEYLNVTVEEVALPLVKFDSLSDDIRDDEPVIVNTSSLAFISAEEAVT